MDYRFKGIDIRIIGNDLFEDIGLIAYYESWCWFPTMLEPMFARGLSIPESFLTPGLLIDCLSSVNISYVEILTTVLFRGIVNGRLL